MDRYTFVLFLTGPIVLLYLVPAYFLNRAFHWAIRSFTDNRWIVFLAENISAFAVWIVSIWYAPILASHFSLALIAMSICVLGSLIGLLRQKNLAPVSNRYSLLRSASSMCLFVGLYLLIWGHGLSDEFFLYLAITFFLAAMVLYVSARGRVGDAGNSQTLQ